MSVSRNSVLAFIPHLSGLVVGLATSIVTARYLGPEGRGVLSIALLTGGALYLLASAGLGTAVTYFVSRGTLDARQALGFAAVASAITGGVVVALALLVWPLLRGNMLRSIDFALYVATISAIPPVVFAELWTRSLMARNHFATASRYGVFVGVSGLTTALIVLGVFGGHATELVWANTAVSFAIAAVAFSLQWHRTGLSFRLPKGFVREAVHYGSRAYAGGLLNYSILRIDTFILNAYAPVAQVGFYSMGVTLSEKLWLMETAVGQAALPEVVARDRDRAAKLVADTVRHLTFLSTMLALALFAFVPAIVNLLYGAEYAPTAALVRILLPGVILYSAGRLLLQFHQGQLGKPGAASLVSLGAAVGGTVLYLVLIPQFGATGAAIASSLTYAGVFGIALTMFVRASGVRIAQVLVPTAEDFAWYRSLVVNAFSWMRHTLTRPDRG